jgi:uncharacterized membrane protein YqjE
MEQQTSRPRSSRSNLIGGLAGLAKNMFGLLMSRIELAAIELAEVRANVLKLAVLFALAIIAAWFAIAYWTVLLVYLTWDSLGWKILLIIAAICTALALGILLYIRSLVGQGKLSMPATMEELRNDHDALL